MCVRACVRLPVCVCMFACLRMRGFLRIGMPRPGLYCVLVVRERERARVCASLPACLPGTLINGSLLALVGLFYAVVVMVFLPACVGPWVYNLKCISPKTQHSHTQRLPLLQAKRANPWRLQGGPLDLAVKEIRPWPVTHGDTHGDTRTHTHTHLKKMFVCMHVQIHVRTHANSPSRVSFASIVGLFCLCSRSLLPL